MTLTAKIRQFVWHVSGAGEAVAQALAKRDALVAERAGYRLERDQAIGERNEFQRQFAEATRASVPTPLRPSTDALRDLADCINAAVTQPSAAFFYAVDRARERFLRREQTLGEQLLAVKLINLLIAKHEYLWGAIATTARPVGFMLDPANQCHLGCPSCTNTHNRRFSELVFKPWPRGLMTAETFGAFIKEAGLYAFSGHFYNNHEPLLNKLTPSFVRAAADLRVHTFISSNLSYRQIDAEAIVSSGLSELMVAIDGATQSVYERYRKGGRIEWVLQNARAIAEAKLRLNSATPVLRWQFLTFEHNVHEVPVAIGLARDLGFDSFNLATPNTVEPDDPTVHCVAYAGPEEHKAARFKPPAPFAFTGDLAAHRDIIEGALAESALARWQRETGGAEPPADKTGIRCDWLHLAVISDAMGRIVPCCNGDYLEHGRMVLANVKTADGNIMNSVDYRTARRVLLDPANTVRTDVICEQCPARPKPQIGLGAVAAYVAESATFARGGMDYLHDWSRHTPL